MTVDTSAFSDDYGSIWLSPGERASASPRARELTCDDEVVQRICYERCGKFYTCIQDKCYCFNKPTIPKVNKNNAVYAKLKELTPDGPVIEIIPEKAKEHSALRHHIAHFCPNLEEARKCIRSCMKIGKPAFCGKDHVCYCGHRYTSHDQEHKLDIKDVYAEFRDLYEKYFGPQNKPRSSNNDQSV